MSKIHLILLLTCIPAALFLVIAIWHGWKIEHHRHNSDQSDDGGQ